MIKIAIAADGGMVSPHFGHCEGYALAVIEGGEVKSVEQLPNPGHEPGLLPRLLATHGVGCIVAGGIGQRAQMLFAQKGIKCITGVQGPVEDAIAAYAAGRLAGGESLCDHDSTGGSDTSHRCRDEQDRRS